MCSPDVYLHADEIVTSFPFLFVLKEFRLVWQKMFTTLNQKAEKVNLLCVASDGFRGEARL